MVALMSLMVQKRTAILMQKLMARIFALRSIAALVQRQVTLLLIALSKLARMLLILVIRTLILAVLLLVGKRFA
ncbi:hypothetical protein A9C11_28235 [Pseudomonas citronellolis]|uniref:Uncharacterized protein n=1 Tax=Pseudomonas citronellolis TaxID=53408 RepID=A0A1A9KIJ3_9PSED|nr:hypothetical protein A9C11_28235 [Pseudomonas citronellolis]